jgi:hypothetical protein
MMTAPDAFCFSKLPLFLSRQRRRQQAILSDLALQAPLFCPLSDSLRGCTTKNLKLLSGCGTNPVKSAFARIWNQMDRVGGTEPWGDPLFQPVNHKANMERGPGVPSCSTYLLSSSDSWVPTTRRASPSTEPSCYGTQGKYFISRVCSVGV